MKIMLIAFAVVAGAATASFAESPTMKSGPAASAAKIKFYERLITEMNVRYKVKAGSCARPGAKVCCEVNGRGMCVKDAAECSSFGGTVVASSTNCY